MTPSQLAGIAAQLVLQETKSEKPTRAVAAMITGASPSNIAKALKATPAERTALVAGTLTIAEIKSNVKPQLNVVMPAAKPRMTMAEFLSMYQALTPAERVAFGRAIGVERVWQPRQRWAARATA
jgi:hypothetical protein